jgi:hypothetical protein
MVKGLELQRTNAIEDPGWRAITPSDLGWPDGHPWIFQGGRVATPKGVASHPSNFFFLKKK